MCIRFDGEVVLNNRTYKYTNGDTFTRYYWYNNIVECWCGYIDVSEEVFNQLDENYCGNTFFGNVDGHHFIGDDDMCFARLENKLKFIEESLVSDYGYLINNDYKFNQKLLRKKTIMECKLVVVKTLTEFLNKYDVSHLELLSELNKELNVKLSKLQEN